METVYLGLGSNEGDSEKILTEAIGNLGKILKRIRVSSLWKTFPQDFEAQPDFLNLVIEGETYSDPHVLLSLITRIEAAAGRNRAQEIQKGPRSLDIDILLFGQHILDYADLTVPHPRLCNRRFVLIPLLELAPAIRNPTTGTPLLDVLARLPPQGIYLLHPHGYDIFI